MLASVCVLVCVCGCVRVYHLNILMCNIYCPKYKLANSDKIRHLNNAMQPVVVALAVN